MSFYKTGSDMYSKNRILLKIRDFRRVDLIGNVTNIIHKNIKIQCRLPLQLLT